MSSLGSCIGVEMVGTNDAGCLGSFNTARLLERESLCLPHLAKDTIVHAGNDGYADVLRQYFPTSESNATERLVNLKARLRDASTHEFWRILMEEMCDITGCQGGLVAKPMLVDNQDSAIEMPELGQPGSCLMGVTFYINCPGVKQLYRDYQYPAYGTPCAHMKHAKVFIIPERMQEFVRDNPNTMPWKQSEAFIGIPLFADGQSFAHVALIWSVEGAKNRKLSWNFIEMFLHSLEDMIVQRMEEGRTLNSVLTQEVMEQMMPLTTTASQSLKPHARSLSHELRTPMQGIVGMLDIMYSTVLDAIATTKNDMIRSVFEDLQSNIEVVQDSSKRAVEAADNVVHAYDLNMQMPDTPLPPISMPVFPSTETLVDKVPPFNPISSTTGHKRAREEDGFDFEPPSKRIPPVIIVSHRHRLSEANRETDPTLSSSGFSRGFLEEESGILRLAPEVIIQDKAAQSDFNQIYFSNAPVSTRHQASLRQVIRKLVNDTIKSSHPTREVRLPTETGESIEVECRGSKGEFQSRTIHIDVKRDVPDVILMDEQYFQFSLHKLIDNAFKFTEYGIIRLCVRMEDDGQMMEIWVADTGCGITELSQEHLFEPHFQQDSSISRAKDGLGLGLFNAKAQVRKSFGGDITLQSSSAEGPEMGSQFLVRLPMTLVEDGGLGTYSLGPPTPRQSSPEPSPISLLPGQLSTSGTGIADSAGLPSVPVRLGNRARSQKRAGFNPNLAKDHPLNFLIAEDNAINRQIAVTSLKTLGYRDDNITVAFDGVEAVNRYEASLSTPTQPRYNAILMDIWMPRVDGYEASRRIMEMAKAHGEATTILAVTADITERCVERAKSAGMRGFLAKPYKLLELERLIVENFPRLKE